MLEFDEKPRINFRIYIPEKWIFICFAILQGLCFYAVDTNLIPTYFHTVHVDKLAITFSIFYLICFNKHHSIRLLLQSQCFSPPLPATKLSWLQSI